MCKSQPTWPVHLSGWHHCTHTPSISARRHRTMLLLVINIHTSLTAPHTLPTSAPPSAPSTCTPLLLHTCTCTNKYSHKHCWKPSSSLMHTVAAHSVTWHSHLLSHTHMAGAQGPQPVAHKLPNCSKNKLSSLVGFGWIYSNLYWSCFYFPISDLIEPCLRFLEYECRHIVSIGKETKIFWKQQSICRFI